MTAGGPRVISRIHSFSERLNRITESFLVVIGMTMALVTGLQVFSRYALNHSLFWSEEVGRICLVWISFLGASAAYKRRAHIGMDFMVVRLPHKTRRTIEMLVVFLSLTFFVVLMVYGTVFACFISGQKTAALGLPLSLTYLVIPFSGAIFSVHAISSLCRLFQSSRQES